MTHSPPVPPGNQSPYPLREAPHPPAPPRPAPPEASPAVPSGTVIGVLAAIGVGAVAAAALWALSGRREPAKTRKTTAKRSAPRRRTGRAKTADKT